MDEDMTMQGSERISHQKNDAWREQKEKRLRQETAGAVGKRMTLTVFGKSFSRWKHR